jgi:hypothetical protein
MSVAAFLLVASAGLAAGTAVDATARSEARTSFLSAPVADGFSNNLTVVGLTPTLRASHQGEGVFLDANYAPNISAIYPSSDLFLLMHRFGGQASFTVAPRLRFGFDLTGAIGDLDAGAAVRDLGNSRASALLGGGQFTQFPFASVIAGGTVGYRLDQRLTLNVGLRNEFTGSPTRSPGQQALLPMQVRPQASSSLTYLLTPSDSLTADLTLRSAFLADKFGTIGNGGGYVSALPSIGYNRTIDNGIVSTTRAGWATAIVDEGIQRDLLLHGLPLLDTRLQASVQLGGESAIEGTVLFGVSPFSDPLGGLLEERISGGVQGAWRVDRNLSFTTSISAFSTLYAIGGNAQIALESSTALGGSVGVGYNITEWVAVTAETLGTSRIVVDKFGRLSELRPEVTFVVGLTGAINLFHEGERPAGTDPRPGRAVGTRPVSLPGSARAFKGTRDDDTKAKKKAKKSGYADDKKKIDVLNDSQLQALLQDDKLLGEADRKALKKELTERKKKAAEAQKKLNDEKAKKDQKAKAAEAREADEAKKALEEEARKKKKKKAAAAAGTTP